MPFISDLTEMQTPTFDWLMPIAPWENPKVLRRALQSLSLQTWKARALVVSVDGKLGDELYSVFHESGLTLEIHESGDWKGAGPVLRRGVLVCKSDIIVRVDSDDWNLPRRSEIQVQMLLSRPSLDVVGGQMYEVEYNDNHIFFKNIKQVPIYDLEIKNYAYKRNPLNHPTVAFRRTKVIEAGNYRCSPYFEDWDLWLRMIRHQFIFENIPEILVYATIGQDHLERRHGIKYMIAEFRFFSQSVRNSSLEPHQAFLQFFSRMPLRIFPIFILKKVMNHIAR